MTTHFNGAELEAVHFNGVDCEKVYFNGTLAFEKSDDVTITVTVLEAGQVWGASTFGNSQFPPLGVVYLLSWGWGESPGMGWIRLNCSNTSHSGSVKVTVGTQVRTLNKNNSHANWGLVQTSTQYNALPKTGTHLLKIEAIA